ncbi:MAG: hypothetical protein JSS79_07450 [Bacteroidetes bacterium]|nr:hypothetical protein [Bacteroidota bacterium]
MRAVIFVGLLLLVSQCIDDRVRFGAPQPEGVRDEKGIPKKMLGSYRSLYDSSILVVGKTSIIRKQETTETLLLDKFLSDIDSIDQPKFKKDTSFTETQSANREFVTIRCEIKKGMVDQTITRVDTLFLLKEDVLRKFKGYYFLNHEDRPLEWSVVKVGIIKQGILLGHIATVEDINKLRQLTNNQNDTVYNFNPSRRQMKQFLKENGFRTEERFVKLEVPLVE